MLRPAVLALLIAATAAPAQEPAPSETPVFGVSTGLVNVTVTVMDEKGRLVTDLRAEDFTVAEDGRPQAVQLFASPLVDEESGPDAARQALSIHFGMMFDTSESMLDDLRLSQQAAVRFLDAIPRAKELTTVFFGEEIRISRYDSESQQGLFERILEAKTTGNTALYDAVAAYLSRSSPEAGRRVVVLFTDGEDTLSGVTRDESLALLQSEGVTVYAIAFDADRAGSARTMRAQAYLSEAAELTGGRVFRPRSYKDLPHFYDEILAELGAQYVIGFASDRPATDHKLRRLSVTVARPGLRVRHRESYQPAIAP